jgi:hypothetical protein
MVWQTMNERIKQLAEQAGMVIVDDQFSTYGKFAEKFAELIVRECVGVVEGGSFLHDQAPTAIFARECSGAIRKHFGVES